MYDEPIPDLHADVLDLPADALRAWKELEAQIEQFNQEQEAAVTEQAFERAAHLRDWGDRLIRARKAVLRDWRTCFVVDPAWLSWNGGAVAALARAIGEDRRWEDLPILADALEEAGCTDAEILGHCREPGEHGSGCWVLELLLGSGAGR
jgi:hypothetical protein